MGKNSLQWQPKWHLKEQMPFILSHQQLQITGFPFLSKMRRHHKSQISPKIVVQPGKYNGLNTAANCIYLKISGIHT